MKSTGWCDVYDHCANRPENPQIRYLHAITALHLREYAMRAEELLQGLYTQISRRGNWYLICDTSGRPLLFRGKFKYKMIIANASASFMMFILIVILNR